MKNFTIKKIIFILQEIFLKNSTEFQNSECNIHASKTNCVLCVTYLKIVFSGDKC